MNCSHMPWGNVCIPSHKLHANSCQLHVASTLHICTHRFSLFVYYVMQGVLLELHH